MSLAEPGHRTSRPPHRRERGGAVAGFVATTGCAVVAAAVLARVDPHQPGHYPACPFLAVTGAYCPGCGSLRAVHDLVHLDLAGAVHRNPFAVVAAVLLAAAWVCWGLRLVGRDAPHPTRIAPVWIWGALALVGAFWVLRNVPGWTWLSPA